MGARGSQQKFDLNLDKLITKDTGKRINFGVELSINRQLFCKLDMQMMASFVGEKVSDRKIA